LLPRAARLRDLNAPGTIKEVIKHVGDVETLKMLYLLSIADTEAVGERAYSRLDLEAMRELYERVLIAMTRQETAEVLSDAEKREQAVQRERERLRRELRKFQWDDETLARVSEGLPAAYVLNTPAADHRHAPQVPGAAPNRKVDRRLRTRRPRPVHRSDRSDLRRCRAGPAV
jgi:[protein-PII] uridylyltransferase